MSNYFNNGGCTSCQANVQQGAAFQGIQQYHASSRYSQHSQHLDCGCINKCQCKKVKKVRVVQQPAQIPSFTQYKAVFSCPELNALSTNAGQPTNLELGVSQNLALVGEFNTTAQIAPIQVVVNRAGNPDVITFTFAPQCGRIVRLYITAEYLARTATNTATTNVVPSTAACGGGSTTTIVLGNTFADTSFLRSAARCFDVCNPCEAAPANYAIDVPFPADNQLAGIYRAEFTIFIEWCPVTNQQQAVHQQQQVLYA